MHNYNTLQEPVEDIILKEKGSRFIGFAWNVQSEAEIRERLESLKDEHPKATHHCYAYRLGINGEKYRANDDGEPSGSAGLPIYNQLLAHGVTNILVVVVRYYGGTKLGVSGLVKTYKECAKATLEAGIIIARELECELDVEFPFGLQNTVFTLLNRYGAKILDFRSANSCMITASLTLTHKKNISDQLSEMQHVSFKFRN